MGSQENSHLDNMSSQVICISLLALATAAAGQETPHKLPVLFQYSEPGHSVAVFRGAQLRQAIAAGLVPGFGNLGNRSGKKIDTSADNMTGADAKAAANAKSASDAKAAANARVAADARARATAAKAAADARAAANKRAAADARARAAAAKDAANARAAADARAAAAAAKAAADARAAAEAARPSQLDLAEQACVQACKNLAGQCRNPFA